MGGHLSKYQVVETNGGKFRAQKHGWASTGGGGLGWITLTRVQGGGVDYDKKEDAIDHIMGLMEEERRIKEAYHLTKEKGVVWRSPE
jgi:hypothetical protein